MKKLLAVGTTDKLKARSQTIINIKSITIMSTFQKTAIRDFKQHNYQVLAALDMDQLRSLQKNLHKMMQPATELETDILRHAPKLKLNISCTEPIYITTVILILSQIVDISIERKIMSAQDLFTNS